MTAIRLIAGLGNPGREYAATRHNAGFWWVDALAQAARASWAKESKFFAQVAKLRADANGITRDIMLMKPQTYMNESGRAVGALAQFYRLAPDEILVVHDELDLPPGTAKLKRGGGTAGHNGLRDIESALGTRAFWRLRLGVGHPREWAAKLGADAPQVVDYVLHAPGADDLAAIRGAMEKSLGLAQMMFDGKMESAIMQLHSAPERRDADAAEKNGNGKT